MKYYHYLFLAILAFSTKANAIQPKIGIYEQFDNLRMVAFIDEKDIDNSPEWNPNSSPLPLTVDKAIQSVIDFTKTSQTPSTIREIEIRTVPKHETHWHYLIKIANDAMKTKYNIYVVLMDGKVIPAIIEPQGYK